MAHQGLGFQDKARPCPEEPLSYSFQLWAAMGPRKGPTGAEDSHLPQEGKGGDLISLEKWQYLEALSKTLHRHSRICLMPQSEGRQREHLVWYLLLLSPVSHRSREGETRKENRRGTLGYLELRPEGWWWCPEPTDKPMSLRPQTRGISAGLGWCRAGFQQIGKVSKRCDSLWTQGTENGIEKTSLGDLGKEG